MSLFKTVQTKELLMDIVYFEQRNFLCKLIIRRYSMNDNETITIIFSILFLLVSLKNSDYNPRRKILICCQGKKCLFRLEMY